MQESSNWRSLLQASLDSLPQVLLERVTVFLDKYSGYFPQDPRICDTLAKVWACSDFVANNCVRHPHVFRDLVESGDLFRTYDIAGHSLWPKTTSVAPDELNTFVRQLRRREMLRIAWRDIAGWAGLEETMADMSRLAAVLLERTLHCLTAELVNDLGQPSDEQGEPVQLAIIAMGKLGAGELNFSSDIDLIFAYAEDGETQGGRRSISHQDFFTRLGRKLIAALDQATGDGFAFRVDMRLRPFGDSGALALSFDAMEHYYQIHGREWERYAMVKAGAIGAAAQPILERLRPFVYRRYLDFSAYDSLRDMKHRISAEMARKGMSDNVKLGPGGIREIEFIAQAFQLIRGGRDVDLQEKQLLKVLSLLAQKALLPEFVVNELIRAYHFLRTAEHHIQEFADQQTHLLPRAEPGRTVLAYSMGFTHWHEFEQVLNAHRRKVHSHFEQVFEAPQVEHAKTEDHGFSDVWLGLLDDAHACGVLNEAGYDPSQQTLSDLKAVRQSSRYGSLPESGRRRMDQLIPLLLGAVAVVEQPGVVLKRLLQLVETVSRRTSYLALLVENPMALSQLVKLCAVSPWINKQLTQQPILLDELLDPRTLYRPPNRHQLRQDLDQRMQGIDRDDLERQMDGLRHFKQANVLRVAAADISGAVPLMIVSDHLTDIAELVLARALDLAWNYMLQRHGKPENTGANAPDCGFAVVAYGKLGGIELGYGSDLDLVFLYQGSQNGETDGAKPLANAVFYSRLGQRMIHLLTSMTSAGILYDVDMRLRPSGASGLLVTHVDSFKDYQLNKAWTWEHQALVRARTVAGDAQVVQQFEESRRQVLGKIRNDDQVKAEVRDMRERMRKELDVSKNGEFDLKQGLGGIADIEFMVQYAVLAHASEHPDLMRFSDNIRVLLAMERAGIINEETGRLLAETYKLFRSNIHRCTLREVPVLSSDPEILAAGQKIHEIWRTVMGAQ
ncbi:MAG: bifunctional [glutamate--ammonia ligase]-adenylyl-L-tyrosine phosphorylase/[glutamate--ammonia-ligase] adenylyltransferase [Gammaproteobacteria bacterium]|nr:bifunctional [glutamate--ammonia ligase]-adenylyl-L-tyrosine phosphorylase/[glutamate--ammonia-ligase] adenylyltransferase [Gammaproteobacteria bacterium]MDH5801746.1 bifunctional [glutamate--ammonia ligase]-adenylyl-L-tyrosine phosphorylase/[glutamate--ammonia-ligase] adenylyltransferase [Gammaproteobacteria bacterium]